MKRFIRTGLFLGVMNEFVCAANWEAIVGTMLEKGSLLSSAEIRYQFSSFTEDDYCPACNLANRIFHHTADIHEQYFCAEYAEGQISAPEIPFTYRQFIYFLLRDRKGKSYTTTEFEEVCA